MKILEILFISENETLKPEEIVYMDGNIGTKIFMKSISKTYLYHPLKPTKLHETRANVLIFFSRIFFLTKIPPTPPPQGP